MAEAEQDHDGPLWKLSQQAHEDSTRWFPNYAGDLVHMTLALCGEAGELANLVKKIQRGDLDIKDAETRYKVMMETTDVQTYVLAIAGLIGLDLDKSVQHIRGQNEARFGKDKKDA